MKISVKNKEEIKEIFTNWNSPAMQARLSEFPDSIVCTTHPQGNRDTWGTPFAIYDDLKSAAADLGKNAHYGVTPLRIWFM